MHSCAVLTANKKDICSRSNKNVTLVLTPKCYNYNTYSHLCTTHYFSPFAVETSGVFGPEALSLVSDIGRLIQAETGEPKSYQFLLQGIAVAVQRGNAASIRGTAHVVDDVFI